MTSTTLPRPASGARIGMRGEALTQREEDAQLRLDFAAFAQHCFRELNPLTRLR